MPETTHKLAAIVFTDIVGFTQLSADNEPAALKLLDTQRKILKPIVEKHKGDWLKEIGDGLLLSFSTILEAVNCAIEIQKAVKEIDDLNLRIGIHQGEVAFRGNDVVGDDVNIASRIEPFSAPGGIAISDRVNASLERIPEFKTTFIGKPLLKGVNQKVEVFCITSHGLPKTDITKVTAKLEQTSPLKRFIIPIVGFGALLLIGILAYFGGIIGSNEIRENTVAVLPFDNYSSAEEDQYFSDGLTGVIIANLAKINDLKVISRNSVMRYKGSTKSLTEIGKELGVSHILEGSVQRGTDRIRIVGQLIDSKTDESLWAETYDDIIEDLFDIQINVAKKIAQALKVEISTNEMTILNKKPTENIEAWDYYLKGEMHRNRSHSAEDNELAEFYFNKAIEADPNFAEAYARLAKHHIFMVWSGFDRSDDRRSKAKTNIDKAMQLDPENPVVRISRGYYYYHGFRDYLRALEDFNYVQQKFPKNPAYHEHISYIERRLGRFKENIDRLTSVIQYDPQNPMLAFNLAESYLYLDDFINSEKYYRKGIMLAPDVDLYYRDLAEVYYRKGDLKGAIKTLDDALGIITSDNLLVAKARLQFVARSYQKSLETLQPVTLNIYKKQTQYMPVETLLGMNYFYLGDKEKANKYLNKSKFILENELKNNSKDLRIHADYALVLAYLGLKDEAINSAEFATLMIPIKKDAIVGTLHFITLTKVLSIVGEHDKAIKNLELMRSVPAGPTLESLKIDPVWDSIRNSPEFKALIKEDFGKISS